MEFKGYSSLWKGVIRPPRCEYDVQDLGPKVMKIGDKKVQRTDFEVENKFGNTLQCSHFEPFESAREYEQLPCVIYMHGNSSARIEALDAVPILLPQNITLFCFDFAGCGMS